MRSGADIPARSILRVVAIVVLSAVALYLVYLLRKPLGWIFMAGFIAIAVSAPVSRLARHVPRGFAIAIVYLGLLGVPAVLAALIIPTVVTQGTNLAEDVPRYAADVQEFIRENERLRDLDEKYDIGSQLQEQAAKLPEKIGDAAGVLSDLGLGLVNSVFALLNILILSVFMVAGGPRWTAAALATRPAAERVRLERVLGRIVAAVSGYVQGALLVATIAGAAAYVVLLVLGVPFALPLAVMVALFSLIPLIGATIAAVLVGLVTLFNDFPSDTIVWTVWAIVYQQLENNLVQPQVQKRTVQVQPIVVLVAVLFGSTLLGVVGAVLAIPIAACVQVVLHEWLDFRRTGGLVIAEELPAGPDDAGPPAGAEPAPA